MKHHSSTAKHILTTLARTLVVPALILASTPIVSTASGTSAASPQQGTGPNRSGIIHQQYLPNINVSMADETVVVDDPSEEEWEVHPQPVEPPTMPTQPQRLVPPAGKLGALVDRSRNAIQAVAGIHSNSPRDLKVLVISADGNETDYPYILATLEQLGLPYDVFVGTQQTLTASMLWDGVGHGYYSAIILLTGSLVYYDPATGAWPSAFDANEWFALWDYEAMFGVRQVTSYTAPFGYPDTYGLNLVTYQDTMVTPLTANLTAAGQQVYSYLKPTTPITFTGAWVYLATVISPAQTTALLTTANGYAIASINQYADGRENLAITAGNNPFLVHSLLLSYGTINWVTKGVFLGERHSYLTAQPDDVLIDSDMWDTNALTDTTGLLFRINATDWTALINWQNRVRGVTPVATTCVIIRPASSDGVDTYINAGSASSNYGNNSALLTDSENTSSGRIRSLLKFNVSNVPAGSTIVSATLNLNLYSNTGRQTDMVEAHRITRAWTEGNGIFLSGATWNRYNGLNNWTTPGGDYDAAVAGSFVASGTGWKTMTVTNLVQSWVSGTVANNGVILLSPPASGNNQKSYRSSDYGTASLRPYVSLCYRPPAPPPVATNTAAFMLEMPFNGEGATGIYNPDTLTPAIIANHLPFNWLSHTYTHLNLDAPATYAQMLQELTTNHAIAVNQLRLTNYVTTSMVQPDISGLYNPAFFQAAKAFGIKYIIADTSRIGWNNPSPNAGFYSQYEPSILIIPRRPTNLFYNLSTPAEWVSEYNCFYGPTGACAGGQWRYWDHNLSYAEILDKESDWLLQYLLKWDIDPLMFHQANLRAYDGVRSLLGDLIDAALAKYNRWINLPIRSDPQHVIGARMAARMTYDASGVQAVLTPCTSLRLSVANSANVPVTGVSYGSQTETYGGQAISFVPVTPNASVTIPLSCP